MDGSTIVVMLVEDEFQFYNLKQTLADYNWNGRYRVLCLTNDIELYMPIRDFLADVSIYNEREFLVEYIEKEKLTYEDAKEYINTCRYIFLWDSNTVLLYGGIESLIKDYADYPKAGFIAGNIMSGDEAYFLVDDLYSKEVVATAIKPSSYRMVKIDTTNRGNLVTGFSELFRKFDFNNKTIFDYGLELRRLGFVNYLDNGVSIKS